MLTSLPKRRQRLASPPFAITLGKNRSQALSLTGPTLSLKVSAGGSVAGIRCVEYVSPAFIVPPPPKAISCGLTTCASGPLALSPVRLASDFAACSAELIPEPPGRFRFDKGENAWSKKFDMLHLGHQNKNLWKKSVECGHYSLWWVWLWV